MFNRNFLLSIFFLFGFFSAVNAATGDIEAFNGILCKIIALTQGSIVKAICLLGLIMISVMLFMGKMNFTVAASLGVSIGGIFGAGAITEMMTDGSLGCE